MTNISRALAVSLLSGAFSLTAASVFAQSSTTPPTTATRPTAPTLAGPAFPPTRSREPRGHRACPPPWAD